MRICSPAVTVVFSAFTSLISAAICYPPLLFFPLLPQGFCLLSSTLPYIGIYQGLPGLPVVRDLIACHIRVCIVRLLPFSNPGPFLSGQHFRPQGRGIFRVPVCL